MVKDDTVDQPATDSWTNSAQDNSAGEVRTGAALFGAALFIVVAGIITLLLIILTPLAWYISVCIGCLCGVLAIMTVHICPQWERVTILKFGRFDHVAGPGLYVVIPFVETAAISVDQRIRTSAFTAEEVLTADLVPVDVDAIIFWMVWDPKKACLEVENYPRAVMWSAQTALRDAIGLINLSDLSMRRRGIDTNLENLLTEKCEPWGVTVLSVEIRDISIPHALQDAMSKEAQAEREKNARVILAEVEKNISELMVDASEAYANNPDAMQLRSFNLLQDISNKGNNFIVIPNAVANAIQQPSPLSPVVPKEPAQSTAE